jgi:hypothetical protein
MEIFSCENDLDDVFDKSEYIKFYPFIGKKYKEISPKILVLGESHYFKPDVTVSEMNEFDNDKSISRNYFLDEYLTGLGNSKNGTLPEGPDGYKHIRCYRNTASMITGKDYHFSDYIWNYLSFFNFFQKHVGRGPKNKEFINEILIENSQRAYFEIINILKPKLVIAWGITDLYNKWVPQNDCDPIEDYLYKNNKYPDTVIWHIPHPSQGFSYDTYHEEFKRITKKTNIDISKLI